MRVVKGSFARRASHRTNGAGSNVQNTPVLCPPCKSGDEYVNFNAGNAAVRPANVTRRQSGPGEQFGRGLDQYARSMSRGNTPSNQGTFEHHHQHLVQHHAEFAGWQHHDFRQSRRSPRGREEKFSPFVHRRRFGSTSSGQGN